jgi:hypothetical protein
MGLARRCAHDKGDGKTAQDHKSLVGSRFQWLSTEYLPVYLPRQGRPPIDWLRLECVLVVLQPFAVILFPTGEPTHHQ